MSSGNSSAKSEKLLQTELLISYVLRSGVILCAIVISIGILLTWFNSSALHQFSDHVLPALLSGETVSSDAVPRSAADFSTTLSHFDPNAVIAVGLLLLIALPIARVALTVFLFLFERDFVYFFITLFVLGVLISGILLGRAL